MNTNIKKLRCEFHLSQEYMAKYLGINTSSYAEIELGNRKPSLDEIAKLNKIFGITLDNLKLYPQDQKEIQKLLEVRQHETFRSI